MPRFFKDNSINKELLTFTFGWLTLLPEIIPERPAHSIKLRLMLGAATFMSFIQRVKAYNYDIANPVDGGAYFSTTVNGKQSRYAVLENCGLINCDELDPPEKGLLNMLRNNSLIPKQNDFIPGYYSIVVTGKCDQTLDQYLLRMFGETANKTLEDGFSTVMKAFCKMLTDQKKVDDARASRILGITFGSIGGAALLAILGCVICCCYCNRRTARDTTDIEDGAGVGARETDRLLPDTTVEDGKFEEEKAEEPDVDTDTDEEQPKKEGGALLTVKTL